MPIIEDCLSHIEEACDGAYPRAIAAVGILRGTFRRIQTLSQSSLWGEAPVAELRVNIKEILNCSIHGQPIEQLIDASSLGEPVASALRSRVDPNLVKRVIQRAQELAIAVPLCPACDHEFRSPDHDPFCSSCVDAGWDLAWVRGYSAGHSARHTESPTCQS